MTDIDRIKKYLQDSTWPFTRDFSRDVELIEKEVLSLSMGLFAMSAYKTLADEGWQGLGLMIHSLAILLMFQLDKDERRGIRHTQGIASNDAILHELSALGQKYMKEVACKKN